MRHADGGLSMVERVYAMWGRHPRLYAAQDWITFLGRHRKIRARAVAATGAGPGARVLEVCCGTGRNFEPVEDRIGPSGRLVGFDYSPEMLGAAGDLAKRRGYENVELVQGDAAVLDVGDARFDAVFSVLGLSAVPDAARAIERCREVLREGGVLSVCDARLPGGPASVGAPLLRAVYGRLAAWNPDQDLVAHLRRTFGEVHVETMNLGTFFIATATRRD